MLGTGMILALDTSTAACTAALFGPDGELLGTADEVIGRGHAERLMPMIADLLAGHRADRILVGCGPGSFTGLRVGIAAAHGMAIGWSAQVHGLSSIALLALAAPSEEPVAAAMIGGHGELFVQEFAAGVREPTGPLLNLKPEAAAATVASDLVVGPGAAVLVQARGRGQALDRLPSASAALALPDSLRTLRAQPIYGRAPDARPKAA
ncbi:tRNA (adenosine(37)-N6)-threonylcarbamoyltransferase complex dimerization subunit type 1 TsaB [Sphingomonas sp. GCM10030256]|uniref:tRNA (adenosine(37)-N6)-threonylcarbamoyltransferase complex dimerization subunit type 1 TsaB n=1 Tax=Sphingomonas sp. GCM10030256 TaxID=3273427 RepID=UPI003605EB36